MEPSFNTNAHTYDSETKLDTKFFLTICVVFYFYYNIYIYTYIYIYNIYVCVGFYVYIAQKRQFVLHFLSKPNLSVFLQIMSSHIIRSHTWARY